MEGSPASSEGQEGQAGEESSSDEPKQSSIDQNGTASHANTQQSTPDVGKPTYGEGKEEEDYFPYNLFQKFAEEPVKLRVHDVTIEGNVRTKNPVIEAEFKEVKNAETSIDLLREVALAMNRIQSLGIFEDCMVSLEPGPVELPGTANVVVKVKESDRLYSGDMGIYSRPETRTWTCEGSLKLKNLLGYVETWDGTGSYSWDGTTEMSAGLAYPRFKGLPATLVARTSIFNQDWRKYSSYTERLVGVSVGLVTGFHHELTYNLTWKTLEDPDHIASHSVRRQLGHSLLSSIKYVFNLEKRNSPLRPTRGYAFRSATQVAGIGPDSRLLRFVRQELDLRCAMPLGIFGAALNLGVSGGMIVPWGSGFWRKATPISDRFFIGGNSSLVCGLTGPSVLPGFRSRGFGPMEARRRATTTAPTADGSAALDQRDALGGDLAVTSFADLSFDLPFSFLREQNIHAHCFVGAGSLFGLSEINRQSLSWEKLWSATRVSAGAGIVIPTRLFRLEVNYCRILREFDWDHSKLGIQLSFAPPG